MKLRRLATSSLNLIVGTGLLVLGLYALVAFRGEPTVPFHSVLTELGIGPYVFGVVAGLTITLSAARELLESLSAMQFVRQHGNGARVVRDFYKNGQALRMRPDDLRCVIASELGILLPYPVIHLALSHTRHPLGILLLCAQAGNRLTVDARGAAFTPTNPGVFRLYERWRPLARHFLAGYEATARIVRREYS
jgi:hypothetical protein